MIEWTFRPIERWPRELDPLPTHSPFRANWNSTVILLRKELAALDAESVVIQLAVREKDIRVDGGISQVAQFKHQGAIVAFHSRYGPLQLPCDWFNDWHHNVRAIAMHLEHLRLAGLYGVGRWGEQYRGWKALPDPTSLTPAMNAEQAAQRPRDLAREKSRPRTADLFKIRPMRNRGKLTVAVMLACAFAAAPLLPGCSANQPAIQAAQNDLAKAQATYAATTQATAQAEAAVPAAPAADQATLAAIARQAQNAEALAKKGLDVAQATLDQLSKGSSFNPNDPAFVKAVTAIASTVTAVVPGGAPFAPLVAILIPSLAAIAAGVISSNKHAAVAQKATNSNATAIDTLAALHQATLASSLTNPPTVDPPPGPGGGSATAGVTL